MIKAEILADSKNQFGNRITTMKVTMPRIILAEFNTHRMFSRNSASSRAIPFEKMYNTVNATPFIPIAWQKDHKGMQGSEYITRESEIKFCRDEWLRARDKALEQSIQLQTSNVTKQLCNRLLEPFMWQTVIVTATEWENFFALRCPKYIHKTGNEVNEYRNWKDLISHLESLSEEYIDNWKNESVLQRLLHSKGQAEIHMMALAEVMWDAYNESTPRLLKAGEWHIPFGDKIDNDYICIDLLGWDKYRKDIADTKINEYKIAISTAMCARVSYTTIGEENKKANYSKDVDLHDKLAASGHMSPFEHCARAMSNNEYYNHINGVVECNRNQLYGDEEKIQQISIIDKQSFGWSGNFRGFVQYRKMIPNENIL